jgi:hypothetical protein
MLVCFEINTKYINTLTLCAKNVEYNDKPDSA